MVPTPFDTPHPIQAESPQTAMSKQSEISRFSSAVAKTASIAIALMVAACSSSMPGGSSLQAQPEAKPNVAFVDLQGFDRELGASLVAPLPKIDVAFIDVVKPSAIPERLQKWMAAVEAGGGSVVITQPKSELQSRALFAIVSAVTTAWSASKFAKEYSQERQFKAAQNYNAEILLKRDATGDTIVDKVVFTQRAKAK